MLEEDMQRDEARGALVSAIINFDWKKFLGDEHEQEIFLRHYDQFRVQLRRGDELGIEIRKMYDEGTGLTYPVFDIVLHTSAGEKKSVESWFPNAHLGRAFLYQDYIDNKV